MPVVDHVVNLREVERAGDAVASRVYTDSHDCHALRVRAQADHDAVQSLSHKRAYVGAVGIHKGEYHWLARELRQRDQIAKLVMQFESRRGNACQVGSLQTG